MEKILRAIYFAADKHNGQLRKDGKTPVITHLLSVALLLSRITDDENIIIAGILHDTLEDTETTKDELDKQFGKKVRKIVEECTEEDRGEGWENRWHERKDKTLKKIKAISYAGALVLSADTANNGYELEINLAKDASNFIKFFHSNIGDKIAYDRRKLNELAKYHKNDLLKQIRKNLKATVKIAKKLNLK